jgi:hypothetical protein
VTFRERVEASPVGWLIGVGSAGFVAGLLVMLGVIQIIIADRGPRDRQAEKTTPQPTRAPTLQLPVGPTATPATFQLPVAAATASPTVTPADSGSMEMTIQQFTRKYLELDGRYAEQEAYLKRADRKRVRWRVLFMFPKSNFTGVVAYFDVPAESRGEPLLNGSPLRWANFPQNFRDRLYSLKRGDLIEITGVLHVADRNTVTIEADDFDVVIMPTPTRAPKRKPH